MHSLGVYCSYCGKCIAGYVITANDKAHIQHVDIQAVCEVCDLPTTNKYTHEQHFRREEPKQEPKKCINCGGQMTNGSCSACTAIAPTRCLMCGGTMGPDGKCPARDIPGHNQTSTLTYTEID
jgi:hypothetical protein